VIGHLGDRIQDIRQSNVAQWRFDFDQDLGELELLLLRRRTERLARDRSTPSNQLRRGIRRRRRRLFVHAGAMM
jgi:hypothetical protein